MEAAFFLDTRDRPRTPLIDSPEIASMTQCPVVTFSHLRWNSVFQRPHHIMTRLAEHRDVLFVEEPVLNGAVAGLEVMRVAPRIRVVQLHLPIDGPGFGPRQQRILIAHLERFLDREGWSEFAAWLYTPMATPIARAVNPRAIVDDCMDEPEVEGVARQRRAAGILAQTSWDETADRMDAILRRITSQAGTDQGPAAFDAASAGRVA
jgi:hypothetical protein